MVSIKVCIIFVVFVFACLTKGQSGQEKTRLQKLESIVTALQQKVESLEWKNELQQQQIDNQQAEIQQLQAELESEKLTADLVKKELQTLYDKLHGNYFIYFRQRKLVLVFLQKFDKATVHAYEKYCSAISVFR